ncbi:4Fe-4S ferredoxin iron-sulfur binding domain protein [Desulfitobacterium hafniense DCB-2]|uniref:Hdr-like menaquinol oxidoreductase iron-sulfur subunit 1 n=4 Tax=root TaxID=1 RepID=A0A098AUV7_DESHA|nr:4Fe-4S dicluster domain-containing protein [Desulfitobacterium hafniense]ACL18327.1 4Fe-4S ferredoxin iron-sulfur binding domain protein [Desulfitobacterium hafniense DCB-2]EHL08064.1 Tat pathway signal sequence domain protein [Desulfitobacterium hafniense DP7]MEA5025834.1 4Fe-4S dicluster domain-containing protein [Desulfitobacterium hafniense]CDX00308.1 Hdr-like menaquinol oxidoreductase iron-sulfur subunit 1 [Desulfitobacterium hafniense]
MSINRREFLKKAGVIAALGLGGAVTLDAFELLEPLKAADFTSENKLAAQRWAMVIDMSKLSQADIDEIIKGCHELHNVPDMGNEKDEIKWIWTDTYEHVFPGDENHYLDEKTKTMPFLTLCNHCDHPPCVRVCPTQATFRREDGVVGMDMHRCIGCRFCMAACPYGARSFNYWDPKPHLAKINPEYPHRSKGVVEKCTFCMDRLDQGLAPVCVEKSKGAIVYGDLEDPNSAVRKVLSTHYSIRRKPELGSQPSVYYLIGGEERA